MAESEEARRDLTRHHPTGADTNSELKLSRFSELRPSAAAQPYLHWRAGAEAGPHDLRLVLDGADATPRPLGKAQAPPWKRWELLAAPTSSF